MHRSIWIGWDPREAAAWEVARRSILRRLSKPIPVKALCLSELIASGRYTRPTESRDGRLWDFISDAPMATEHANARFLVKELAKEGWALFMDGDILARADVTRLFEGLNPDKAAYCVHHHHDPGSHPGLKMDGQIQTRYARKNWSSVMAINCDHPANQALTVDLINSVPGRDLHRFCWLEDGQIGEIDPEWNYLVGVTKAEVEPKIAHFTLGAPDMPGWEDQPYADEWRAERDLARAAV
jgi:hypothetical protein